MTNILITKNINSILDLSKDKYDKIYLLLEIINLEIINQLVINKEISDINIVFLHDNIYNNTELILKLINNFKIFGIYNKNIFPNFYYLKTVCKTLSDCSNLDYFISEIKNIIDKESFFITKIKNLHKLDIIKYNN